MTEQLASGWWRCNCDVPCNCKGKPEGLKKINPPSVSVCVGCGRTNVRNAKAKIQRVDCPECGRRLKDGTCRFPGCEMFLVRT